MSFKGESYIRVQFALFIIITHGHCMGSVKNLNISLEPDSSIQAIQGQGLTVRCVSSVPLIPNTLSWMADGKNMKRHFTTRKVDNRTSELHIQKVEKSDAGKYHCFFNSSGIYIKRTFTILVHSKESGAHCHHTQFRCSEQNVCIFSSRRCDGYEDCPDKSDEKGCIGNPCEGKFKCRSGRCVSRERLCTKDHQSDCIDHVDEMCQQFVNPSIIPSVVSDEPSNNEDDDTGWFKTTIYTIIGCAVGVVLLISSIVVFLFRSKMRKNEHQRAVGDQGRSDRVDRPTNNVANHSAAENEPFINSTSPSFGNTTGANSCVQYVQRESQVHLLSPPSYSDVMQESRQQQASPPPPYSTFDRNASPASGSAQTATNVNYTGRNIVQQDQPLISIQTDSWGNDMRDQNTNCQVDQTGYNTTEARRNIDCGTDSNLSTVASSAICDSMVNANRPKQSKIEVRDGQIMLACESSPSTSTHHHHHETETSTEDGRKPTSQLFVRNGEIILTNPRTTSAEGDTPVNTSSCSNNDICNSDSMDSIEPRNQGHQLEVKAGQLVFKNGV